MALDRTISKLRFPFNSNISAQITVTLEYKEYYSDTWILIDSGVNVGVDGTILDSPLPTISIDPALKYVIKATNELCGYEYIQTLIINAYCPPGYEVSPDGTYCFYEEVTEATPPTATEDAVSTTASFYNTFGTVIMDEGYNVNGTGSFTQINYSNGFWVNGPGAPSIAGNTSDGPLNRTGVWSSSVFEGQILGFSACVEVPEDGVYYVGIAGDDKITLKIDGNTIVDHDKTALYNYFIANGYPDFVEAWASFIFWYIYPVFLTKGTRVIEMICENILGTMPGGASMGCEIYNLTSAEIQSATSYVDLGDGLLFSSKDYIGQPIQIGSNGIGYTCPADYSLRLCSSPVECVRIVTAPILY